MADLIRAIANFSTKPNQPNDRPFEPKTRSMLLWSLVGLAAVAIIAGIVFDMGDGTRTTAPASSIAVPIGPTTPRSGP